MVFSVAREPAVQEGCRTVLVVEDDVLVRLMVSGALRDQGLSVIEASNADEALSVLESSVAISLLLTDIEMPGKMDGLRLAALVHGTSPTMKVILTSGIRPQCSLQSVADAFFLKPFNLISLVRRVKELLTDSDSDANRE